MVMNFLYPGISPSDYVLEKVSNVPANDLEETLLVCLFVQSIIECLMYSLSPK